MGDLLALAITQADRNYRSDGRITHFARSLGRVAPFLAWLLSSRRFFRENPRSGV
jgi:hypothetical protein